MEELQPTTHQLLPSLCCQIAHHDFTRPALRELMINPNTVARAYQQLQADNVLESVRGRGLIVKKRATQRCRKQRQLLIQERLEDALREAFSSGLNESDVRELMEQALAAQVNSSDAEGAAGLRADGARAETSPTSEGAEQ